MRTILGEPFGRLKKRNRVSSFLPLSPYFFLLVLSISFGCTEPSSIPLLFSSNPPAPPTPIAAPFEHGFESTLYGAINSLRRVAFLAPSRHGKGICKREDSRTSHRESDVGQKRKIRGRKKQRRGATVANEDEGR